MTTEALQWEDPRTVLKRHDLWAKRAFSQNFLVARPVVERIAERVRAMGTDTVVELGPGLGTLTKALLSQGCHVHAIERDRDMIAVLNQELSSVPQFAVREGDAARVDFAALRDEVASHATSGITVVGNLPYAVTGAILRNVMDAVSVIPASVFMVQREVRDRLQAEADSSEYGALTVFTRAMYDVATLMHVGRTCFHPAPKVTSSVVVLTRRATPRAVVDESFQRVVKAAFGTRRKTLRNALLRLPSVDAAHVDAALASASIDGKRRGETLSVEEFGTLSQHLARQGVEAVTPEAATCEALD